MENQALFARMHDLQPGDPARRRIRDDLIVLNLPLSRRLARRHWSKVEPLEDMEQVAAIGLIKSVDDYDPRFEVPFVGYAVPKISGELWRYLRDYPGTVRVPRTLQELQTRLRSASEELAGDGQAAPGPRVLADRVEIEESAVVEALVADRMRFPRSLDSPAAGTEVPLREVIGRDDAAIEAVERRESVDALMCALPERERFVVQLCVMQEVSQRRIAEIVGVSQMQVSRLRTHALDRLRRLIGVPLDWR
ncbi:sigma-70 family RNA polymerase sigma factor [Planotetraspora sp. GP83]|uniref:sigma-70 family RNA polymerase sigma factor n=1 Tax=Planotetraspora sp. GP83 TaxID=3156264 RepID=UPI0035171D5B